MTVMSPHAEIERRLIAAMRQQLGPIVCGRVIEVMLNSDGVLWEDRLGHGMSVIGRMQPSAAESFIGTVASTLHTSVTRDSPILECELPIRGARFEALIPPLVQTPVFAIRLKVVKVFSLAEYVADGIMTERQRAVIEDAVYRRQNILIVGGTATGKTTLSNAVLAAIAVAAPRDLLLILEDHRRASVRGRERRDPSCDRGGRHAAAAQSHDAAAAGPHHRWRGARRRGAFDVESLEHRPSRRALHDPRKLGRRGAHAG